ncbi:hypothetical protein Tco_1383037, partial [Tanacetum coccineum]
MEMNRVLLMVVQSKRNIIIQKAGGKRTYVVVNRGHAITAAEAFEREKRNAEVTQIWVELGAREEADQKRKYAIKCLNGRIIVLRMRTPQPYCCKKRVSHP